jgi:hypothetical protein
MSFGISNPQAPPPVSAAKAIVLGVDVPILAGDHHAGPSQDVDIETVTNAAAKRKRSSKRSVSPSDRDRLLKHPHFGLRPRAMLMVMPAIELRRSAAPIVAAILTAIPVKSR